MSKVEGQRRRRQVELLRDRACRQSFRTPLYQQAINGETRGLRQGGECIDDLRRFHISRIMETSVPGQPRAPDRIRYGACYLSGALPSLARSIAKNAKQSATCKSTPHAHAGPAGVLACSGAGGAKREGSSQATGPGALCDG